MKYCPITNVNIKRFWLSVAAGFVFIWLYEYVLHGIVLTDLYAQTPNLWRTQSDMATTYPVLIITQFVTSLFTAFIFTRHYEGRGITEGLRYGKLIGMLFAVLMMAQYSWLPISSTLAFAWFAIGFFKGLGLGVIFAALYRK